MNGKLNFRNVLTIVAMFATVGLYAQTAIPGWDNGAGGDNYDNAGATYVTVGKTVPLYASPDGYYHPSYDPTNGSGLTGGFTWTWTVPVGPGFVSLGGGSDNYIEVTGVAAGTSTINVVEEAGWAASCTDAGTNITINVVAEPSVAFSGTSVNTTDCEGGTFPSIAATIAGGYQDYKLAWTLEISSTDGATVPTITWYDDETGANPTGTAKFAAEYTTDDAGALPGPQAVAAAGDHDITTVAAFNAIGGESTTYTFTINGVNDQASRWGDFLTIDGADDVNDVDAGEFLYYNTVAQTRTIIVHPTPTTGPIFHIDAGWAN